MENINLHDGFSDLVDGINSINLLDNIEHNARLQAISVDEERVTSNLRCNRKIPINLMECYEVNKLILEDIYADPNYFEKLCGNELNDLQSEHLDLSIFLLAAPVQDVVPQSNTGYHHPSIWSATMMKIRSARYVYSKFERTNMPNILILSNLAERHMQAYVNLISHSWPGCWIKFINYSDVKEYQGEEQYDIFFLFDCSHVVVNSHGFNESMITYIKKKLNGANKILFYYDMNPGGYKGKNNDVSFRRTVDEKGWIVSMHGKTFVDYDVREEDVVNWANIPDCKCESFDGEQLLMMSRIIDRQNYVVGESYRPIRMVMIYNCNVPCWTVPSSYPVRISKPKPLCVDDMLALKTFECLYKWKTDGIPVIAYCNNSGTFYYEYDSMVPCDQWKLHEVDEYSKWSHNFAVQLEKTIDNQYYFVDVVGGSHYSLMSFVSRYESVRCHVLDRNKRESFNIAWNFTWKDSLLKLEDYDKQYAEGIVIQHKYGFGEIDREGKLISTWYVKEVPTVDLGPEYGLSQDNCIKEYEVSAEGFTEKRLRLDKIKSNTVEEMLLVRDMVDIKQFMVFMLAANAVYVNGKGKLPDLKNTLWTLNNHEVVKTINKWFTEKSIDYRDVSSYGWIIEKMMTDSGFKLRDENDRKMIIGDGGIYWGQNVDEDLRRYREMSFQEYFNLFLT